MSDLDPDDDGYSLDASLGAISDIKNAKSAAPPPAPVEQKVIGADYVGGMFFAITAGLPGMCRPMWRARSRP
jgi:hypothetical protein